MRLKFEETLFRNYNDTIDRLENLKSKVKDTEEINK